MTNNHLIINQQENFIFQEKLLYIHATFEQHVSRNTLVSHANKTFCIFIQYMFGRFIEKTCRGNGVLKIIRIDKKKIEILVCL